jgi:guanylate kinase
LRQRLEGRHTEAVESLERRLNMAAKEMEQVSLCDYVVVNRDGQAQQAAACIDAIVTAEKCRVQPRKATV